MSGQMVLGIVTHTPIWVWPLLAYLVWVGVQALKPRKVGLRRVALVPLIFLVWGLSGLMSRPFPAEIVAAFWLGGFIAGLPLGLLTGPRLMAVDRTHQRLHLPGSGWPLARNLAIFLSHYALNVAAAILAAWATALMEADIAVSGASAGYFIGWGLALWRGWRVAPDAATATTASAG